MARQDIVLDVDTGAQAEEKIRENFTELYTAKESFDTGMRYSDSAAEVLFDYLPGYQHGTEANPILDAVINFSATNAKRGSKVIIVLGTELEPTLEFTPLTVTLFKGQFKEESPAIINLLIVEYMDEGNVLAAYTQDYTHYLLAANNLSDLPSPSTARENLGLPALFDAKADKEIAIVNKTASAILALTDAGKLVEMDVATANTLTVPPNADVAFAIGTEILVSQYNDGQTTLTPGSGVTLRSSGSKLKLTGKYSAATLVKRGTNEWYVMGELSA